MNRLLWINHFALPPSHGGGTRHFEVGVELGNLGWNVTIAAADFGLNRKYTVRNEKSDTMTYREHHGNVEICYLWSAPYSRNDWRRIWNWFTFARSLLAEASIPGSFHIVIGSSPHLFAALAGLRIARRNRVPFVFEVRDLWPESLFAVSGRKSVPYYAMALVANYLYRGSQAIVCLSRGTQRYLADVKGLPVSKLFCIPNGVNPAAFDFNHEPVDDRFILIYAGAHGPANGLDQVVEAAALLISDERIVFRLVGDGPEKERLVRKAAAHGLTNVEFVDSVPKSQVAQMLAEASAGLMVLKEAELFSFGVSPNKLFDYMAASLPIVCNVPGETAEMVAEAGAGVQTRDGSAEALVDAVREVASWSDEERRRRGESGRVWVSRNHSREVLAESLDRVLRETMEAYR